MKRTTWMAWAAAGMAAAVTAGAAPFNAADVAADAGWFAHADLDLLKTTEVGQYVMSKVTAPEAERKLAAFLAVFGFDPRRDVNSITAYGRTDRPQQGLILVHGRLDQARLTTLLQANDSYQSSPHGACVIHSWVDDKKKKEGRNERMYGAFHGETVVIGSALGDVQGALDVLDAKKPGLAGSPRLAVLGASPVPPVLAVVLDASAKGQVAPKAEILKLAQRGSLTLGEAAGIVRARLLLEAPDAGTAGEMMKIADGMRSLMILNREKDPNAARLAEGSSVSASGAQVTVTLDYPAAELIKAAEAKEAGEKQK